MADYTIDPIFGCWNWIGRIDEQTGYGLIWRGKSPIKAHIVVYGEKVGPVPPGLVLDHACVNPRCVAPHHLEPITQVENLRRRNWKNRSALKKCKAGHDLADNAIVTPTKGRVCRQCNADSRGVGW